MLGRGAAGCGLVGRPSVSLEKCVLGVGFPRVVCGPAVQCGSRPGLRVLAAICPVRADPTLASPASAASVLRGARQLGSIRSHRLVVVPLMCRASPERFARSRDPEDLFCFLPRVSGVSSCFVSDSLWAGLASAVREASSIRVPCLASPWPCSPDEDGAAVPVFSARASGAHAGFRLEGDVSSALISLSPQRPHARASLEPSALLGSCGTLLFSV